ncbi:MAG TPA: inositol-3-phosphate synthase [Candidatus Lokiarchaeia archaeon]|nr:inositol-3-phosphate synthase [Candidatus Lokiarchaeia archaeon]
METKFSDEDVLRFLEDHTYDQAMEEFGISRMTIARIKKRNVRKSEYTPEKIKLAIVGVGNAASALVQGIEYYKYRQTSSGLLRPTLAGYHISDIEVVVAFDISAKKVGKLLADALRENDFPMMVEFANGRDVYVLMAPILDGVIEETREIIDPSGVPVVDVVQALKDSEAEIVLCLLPSGADTAVEYYAEQALAAGCAFINATPTKIATNKTLAKRFQQAGLPVIGDDLQDQFGATILHKLILQQMLDRGVDIKESYALDVGGGTESLNTLFRSKDVKRAIKSMSVSEALNVDAPIVAGTSDYVPHMGNARNSFLWIVGKGFLGSEIVMDIKIQSEDGPNGGSVLADIIRATKVALNQGAAGAIDAISAYGFKNPPIRSKNPSEADHALANFILGVK